MYIFQVAWRYVWVRFVNYIAIATVAIALVVHIVVMGVLDGMILNMRDRIMRIGNQATIIFYDRADMPTEAELQMLEERYTGQGGILGMTPMLNEYGILRFMGRTQPCMIVGLDLEKEMRFTDMGERLDDFKPDPLDPRWRPTGREGPLPPMYVGVNLAQRLGISAGDEVRLGFAPPEEGAPDTQAFEVVSIYRSGSFMRDRYGVFIPLDEARRLFLGAAAAAEGRTPLIALWLEDPHQANAITKTLIPEIVIHLGRMDRDVSASTWQMEWQNIYQGMAYENALQEVVMVMMKIMAGFCVFGILVTLVSRHVRDIGLLRCLGAGRRGVMGIFILVGFYIGLAGAVLGVGIGVPLAIHINEIWEFFTGQKLYAPHGFGLSGGMPVVIHAWKTAVYAGAAVLIAVLASLAPATWASRRRPIQALQDG